jgi:hypothetical protein
MGLPLDVWNNDNDAFLASWEDLNAGGHGTWYRGSVEEPYSDEVMEAYVEIDRQLNLNNHEAVERLTEVEPEEEHDE